MTREKYIKYGVILVVAVLLFFLLLNIFGGKGHTKLYEKLAASEEREKAIIRERDMLREMYDQKIEEGLKKDSLLAIKINKIEIYTKTIAPSVRSISSKDELRNQGAAIEPE